MNYKLTSFFKEESDIELKTLAVSGYFRNNQLSNLLRIVNLPLNPLKGLFYDAVFQCLPFVLHG
jgi:hypothetical protein